MKPLTDLNDLKSPKDIMEWTLGAMQPIHTKAELDAEFEQAMEYGDPRDVGTPMVANESFIDLDNLSVPF